MFGFFPIDSSEEIGIYDFIWLMSSPPLDMPRTASPSVSLGNPFSSQHHFLIGLKSEVGVWTLYLSDTYLSANTDKPLLSLVPNTKCLGCPIKDINQSWRRSCKGNDNSHYHFHYVVYCGLETVMLIWLTYVTDDFHGKLQAQLSLLSIQIRKQMLSEIELFLGNT